MEKEERKLKELQDKVKRTMYVGSVLEGRIIRDHDVNRLFSWTEPFVFGKNGKLYGRYGFARLCETESFIELLSKMIDFENVVRCEVFEGKMTVSKDSYCLEYCFTQEEYKEAKESYDKLWEETYAIVETRAEAKGMFTELETYKEAYAVGETEVEDILAELETYKEVTLKRMTDIYLKEMDKAERFAGRCETLAEYYCNL